MPTIAGSLFDTNSVTIREEIGNRSTELMLMADSIFNDTIFDSAGVEGAEEGLGRDLRVKQTFYGSLAGVVRGGHINEHVSLYGDQTTQFGGGRIFTNQMTRLAPDPLNGPNPTPFALVAKLYSFEFNMALPLAMLEMEALEANIKQHVIPVLKGAAKQIILYCVNAVHANPLKQYRISSLGPSSGAGAYAIDTAARTITFSPPEKCTHRFAKGQPVDIIKAASTAPALANKSDSTSSRVRIFVQGISDWRNSVTLQIEPTNIAEDGTTATIGTWATIANLLVDSIVVQANTFNPAGTGGPAFTSGMRGMYSLRDWLKWGDLSRPTNERYLLGDQAVIDDPEALQGVTAGGFIDTAVHDEFGSGHFGPVSGSTQVLNERTLLAQLQTANIALMRSGGTLDTLLAAVGIFLNIFDQLQTRERIIRGGNPGIAGPLTMGLRKGFTIAYEGGEVSGETSQFVESGVMYGIKKNGNYRLVVPPSGAPNSRGELMGLKSKIPINFYAKALGFPSDRIPIMRQPTTATNPSGAIVLPGMGAMMPAYSRIQFMPRIGGQIPGVVWDGIQETRQYGDAAAPL